MPEKIRCLETPVDIAGSYHIVTGGKGGIGKSFVARMLAESILYGLSSGDIVDNIELRNDEDEAHDRNGKGQLRFFDVDPVNHSFQSTFGNNARRADIFVSDDNREIDDRQFGNYFFPPEHPDRPLETRIYDIGSNQFDPLFDYFIQTRALTAWEEDKRPFIFHVPLCGYQYFRESLQSVVNIMYATSCEAKIVFWTNDYLPTRETDEGPAIQTFIIEEQKYWGGRQNEFENFEDMSEAVISIDDLYKAITDPHFFSFNAEQLHSIYYYMQLASNFGKNLVVLVNPKAKTYRLIRNSIVDALSKNVLFTEYIRRPEFSRPDRMLLETFFFAGRDSLFRQVMRVLQDFFTSFKE